MPDVLSSSIARQPAQPFSIPTGREERNEELLRLDAERLVLRHDLVRRMLRVEPSGDHKDYLAALEFEAEAAILDGTLLLALDRLHAIEDALRRAGTIGFFLTLPNARLAIAGPDFDRADELNGMLLEVIREIESNSRSRRITKRILSGTESMRHGKSAWDAMPPELATLVMHCLVGEQCFYTLLHMLQTSPDAELVLAAPPLAELHLRGMEATMLMHASAGSKTALRELAPGVQPIDILAAFDRWEALNRKLSQIG